MSQTVTLEGKLKGGKEGQGMRSFRVSLPNIFDYHDYRAYLRDVILARQRNDRKYTIEKFAHALGFSSHSGLIMVLTGKRELFPPYLDRCIKNLALASKQRFYFESLVRSAQLPIAKRKTLLRELEFHTTTWDAPQPSENLRLLDLFLVQQILCLYRQPLKVEEILSHFRYAVDKKDVMRALKWMLDKKDIEQTPQGFRVRSSSFFAQDEIPLAQGRQFHRDCLKLADASLQSDPLEKREFQTFILTADSSRLAELKSRIKKAALEIASEFETELDGDTVVQVHFNMFEVSNRLGDERHERQGHA